jgi:hypothetical protein
METTTKHSMTLKSPYGISNFKKVVTEAYIDKTAYIAKAGSRRPIPEPVAPTKYCYAIRI